MQAIIEYKPWLEYPELWPTEASFWNYLRGALRRGLWEKSPIKLSYKNANCFPPPEGYSGRAKSGAECALTGEWTGKSKMEVDHVDGHKSLLSWEDVLPFILHLVPPKGSLQLVSKEAHKIKSYGERMGITYEEAICEKKSIQKTKQSAENQKKELLSLGFTEDEIRTASMRRECYRKYFRERSGGRE